MRYVVQVRTKILVGLDGSPRQPLVLERAVHFAELHAAELHLARAVTVPVHLPAEVWAVDGQMLTDMLLSQAQLELTDIAATLPASVSPHIHARVGVAADVLCQLADELGAALVVLGTHGYQMLDRVLGTTAAKVVNRANTSVLVVRPTPPTEASEDIAPA